MLFLLHRNPFSSFFVKGLQTFLILTHRSKCYNYKKSRIEFSQQTPQAQDLGPRSCLTSTAFFYRCSVCELKSACAKWRTFRFLFAQIYPSRSHMSISCSANMATLGRSSTKLLRKVQISPVFSRNISQVKSANVSRNVLTTCACVFGGSLLYYAVKTYQNGNTVYALKAKVSACLFKWFNPNSIV